MKSLFKRIVSTVVTSVMLLTIATGCGNQVEDLSVNNIRTRGSIRVAIPNYDSSLLYFDEKAQAYRGKEAEVVDVIATALGVTAEYIPSTKEQMYNSLTIGSADIIIGYLDANSANIANYGKTVSYGGENLYVISPRGVYVGNLGVFSGKIVGVSSLIDSSAYGNVYTSGVESVQLYNNTESVIEALKSGAIAGYICYRSEGDVIASSGEFQIQSCNDLKREEFVVAMLPTASNLLIGCNNHIEAYLEGTELPTWIEYELEEQKKNEVDSNSLFN